ncbi:type II toxin-antitoxin system Phd/YefM family antitoxin [Streptomyces achromogenes]|uniref:type II toxin-antitoxin system Phd/YefM family antitoxin n=1 Tax=Streptomyces achromogenes TaxID=67255 RepID=UPI003414E295
MRKKHVGIEEARKILGDLVDEVRYTGVIIVLTRYGKPVAQILPAESPEREEPHA